MVTFFSIFKRKTWKPDNNNIHGYNKEILEVKENSHSASLHQNEAKADIVHHRNKGTSNALQ